MKRETRFEYLKRAVSEHAATFGHLPPKEQPCLEWPWGKTSAGYGFVKVAGRPHQAHRVSREVAGKPVADGLLGCHICDNRACFNPRHVFDGTAIDNGRDAAAKGRCLAQAHPERMQRGDRHFSKRHPELLMRGERHANSKLTAEAVARIRLDLAAGLTCSAIGRRFGVSRITIYDIVRRRTWTHVPDQTATAA